MAFIALPALQRSQRDTQRRDDMARFMSQVTQFQSNNGNIPGEGKWWSFISSYLRVGGDTFKDPNGNDYSVKERVVCTSSSCPQKSVSGDTQSGFIRVYVNATCNGENPKYESGANKLALTYKLEGSGIYCAHN